MKPPGECGDTPGKIVRLNRSLYDLKQSGRQWVGLSVEAVAEYGIEHCRTDPCVFRMVVNGDVEQIMAVFVDFSWLQGRTRHAETSMPRWLRNSPQITSAN